MNAGDWSMVLSALHSRRQAAEKLNDYVSSTEWTRLMAEIHDLLLSAKQQETQG